MPLHISRLLFLGELLSSPLSFSPAGRFIKANEGVLAATDAGDGLPAWDEKEKRHFFLSGGRRKTEEKEFGAGEAVKYALTGYERLLSPSLFLRDRGPDRGFMTAAAEAQEEEEEG